MSERTAEERAKFRCMAEHLRPVLVDCATVEPLPTESLVRMAERINEEGCLTVAQPITDAQVERALAAYDVFLESNLPTGRYMTRVEKKEQRWLAIRAALEAAREE